MNFFHIWIATVVVSFIMQIKHKLEVYKDVADAGYILNSKKLEILNKEIDKDVDNLSKILINYGIFVPFYNLFVAAIREDNYYKHTEEFIDELKESGVLEVMTDEEKEIYNKKKTGFNAIKIEKKKWLKLSKSHVVVFESKGAIWFDYKDEFEDDIDNFINSIIILYAEGEVAELSSEEQKMLVYNSHISLAETILNSEENVDEFIKNNSSVDYLKLKLEEEDTSLSDNDEEELSDGEEKHIKRVRKR